ncbi:MAG: hypothetical protein K2I79_02805, partial [Clostridia bacterium]|nr:hypothetical protein [Clostridia bacterium]
NLYDVTICDTVGEFEEFTNYVISTYTELISLEGKRIRVSVKALSDKDDKRYIDSDIASITINVSDISSVQRKAEEDALLYYSSLDSGNLNFTYGKKSDDGEINTRGLSVYTGGALMAEGKYLQGFSSGYDEATGYSTISAEYLQRFSPGAIVRLYAACKGGLRQCSISIAEYEAPAVTNCNGGMITYFKSLGTYAYLGLNFSSSVNAVYADGNTRLSFAIADDNKKSLKLDAGSLSKLNEGIHDISIYSGAGIVYCKILIIDDYSEKLEDVRVDIDGYPDIKLSWRGGVEPLYYELKAGGDVYRSDDDNVVIFGDCEADITAIARQGDKIELIAHFENGKKLNAVCYVPSYEAYIPYLQEQFYYIGESYNAYIDSVDEWYAAVGHCILHYNDLQDGARLCKSVDFAIDI